MGKWFMPNAIHHSHCLGGNQKTTHPIVNFVQLP